MIRRLLVVSAILLVAPSITRAHKMELRATSTADNMLRVEVAYEGGGPSDATTVTVTNAAGVIIVEGTTDVDGVCVLPRPPDGAYTITADDGAGHRVQLALTDFAGRTQTASRDRLLMTLLGLVVIAGVTLLARRLLRKPG